MKVGYFYSWRLPNAAERKSVTGLVAQLMACKQTEERFMRKEWSFVHAWYYNRVWDVGEWKLFIELRSLVKVTDGHLLA